MYAAYFGVSGALSIETIFEAERNTFAQSCCICEELSGNDLENLFDIEKYAKSQREGSGDQGKQKNQRQPEKVTNKLIQDYMQDGLSENCLRVVRQALRLAENKKGEEAVDAIVKSLSEDKQMEKEVEFEFNEGVTLAVRVEARFNDFF